MSNEQQDPSVHAVQQAFDGHNNLRNPRRRRQDRGHIADYHIGDTEEHRALADAIQEQMIYRALCHEATMRGKWIGQ